MKIISYLIGVKDHNGIWFYAEDAEKTRLAFVARPYAKHFRAADEACLWWEENKVKFEKYIDEREFFDWDNLAVVKYVTLVEPVINLN